MSETATLAFAIDLAFQHGREGKPLDDVAVADIARQARMLGNNEAICLSPNEETERIVDSILDMVAVGGREPGILHPRELHHRLELRNPDARKPIVNLMIYRGLIEVGEFGGPISITDAGRERLAGATDVRRPSYTTDLSQNARDFLRWASGSSMAFRFEAATANQQAAMTELWEAGWMLRHDYERDIHRVTDVAMRRIEDGTLPL